MLDFCFTSVQTLVQPLRYVGGTLHVWRCVLASWVLAAVVAIPQSIAFVQTEEEPRLTSADTTGYVTTYKCDSAGYTAEWQRKLYFTFFTLFLYIIPACIMIYCYANIVRVVWLRAGPEAANEPRVHFVTTRRSAVASDPAVCVAEVGSSIQQPSPNVPRCHSLPRNSREVIGVPRVVPLTTKRSVIRMAISVTVGFVVCWTPLFAVTGVRVYSDYEYKWTAAQSVSIIMGLSHSVVNPIVYIVFSIPAVRAAFLRLCQRAMSRCCQRHQASLGLH